MIEEVRCCVNGETYYDRYNSHPDDEKETCENDEKISMSDFLNLYGNTGVIMDRSYDFILRLGESLLDTFQSCGRYCDTFNIQKVTDEEGRIYYVLRWE